MLKFVTVSSILLAVIISGCSSDNDKIRNSPQSEYESDLTLEMKNEQKVVVQPILGDSLSVFKEKYGLPNSTYMDAYGFDNDTINVDTENDLIKDISLRFSDDSFLNADDATDQINKFLPNDSVKVAENTEDGLSFFAYESSMIAELFKDNYIKQEAEVKGRIFVGIKEGNQDSDVRREGETVARMKVGIDLSEERKLGLKE